MTDSENFILFIELLFTQGSRNCHATVLCNCIIWVRCLWWVGQYDCNWWGLQLGQYTRFFTKEWTWKHSLDIKKVFDLELRRQFKTGWLSNKKWSNRIDEEQFDGQISQFTSCNNRHSYSVILKSSTSKKPVYSIFILINCIKVSVFTQKLCPKVVILYESWSGTQFALFPFLFKSDLQSISWLVAN